MSGQHELKVQRWEAWIEGDRETVIQHECLFPATIASRVGQRFGAIGEKLTVLVRLADTEDTPLRFQVEGYVEFATIQLKAKSS